MKRAMVLFAVLLALTGVIAGQAAAARTTPAAAQRLQGLEQALLTRLNSTRVSHGLRPLTLSGDLSSAAAAHSRSMLEDGYFQHESKDGSPFFERLRRFYRPAGYDRWSVGENLLYSSGELDAPAAMKAWLESPSHREIMLTPTWRDVGVSALHASAAPGTFGGEPTWVITMDFGVRTGKKPTRQVTVHSTVAQTVQRVLPVPVPA
jgi:uncharacterized protein YkwD